MSKIKVVARPPFVKTDNGDIKPNEAHARLHQIASLRGEPVEGFVKGARLIVNPDDTEKSELRRYTRG